MWSEQETCRLQVRCTRGLTTAVQFSCEVICEAPPLASSGSLVARVFNQLRHCIRLVAPSRQDPQSEARSASCSLKPRGSFKSRSLPCCTCWRREVKTKRKIRLLAMSKAEKEKRLDELNQKLGITHPNKRVEYAQEEMEEREWLKKKLGYEGHRI